MRPQIWSDVLGRWSYFQFGAGEWSSQILYKLRCVACKEGKHTDLESCLSNQNMLILQHHFAVLDLETAD